jgi:hypothetical protein
MQLQADAAEANAANDASTKQIQLNQTRTAAAAARQTTKADAAEAMPAARNRRPAPSPAVTNRISADLTKEDVIKVQQLIQETQVQVMIYILRKAP